MTSTAQERCVEVAFVTRILTHYRVPFHERVRALLAERDVRYRLICGQPSAAEAAKGDLATLPWAQSVRNAELFGRNKLIWQHIQPHIRKSALVILGQENQLLVNYPLQLFPKRGRKIALFGHGRNFQSRNPGGLTERWKSLWATRCDWWFAYTEETRRHVESLGFPSERITVFNNAIDTTALKQATNAMTDSEAADIAAKLGVRGNNAAIFVGGLYPDKRLYFLVEATELVRNHIPDFELIVIGSGPDRPLLEKLAARHPWIIMAGPRFGRDKVALMRKAKLFLMPGLVGLAVLDAAAMELPMITTAWPWHSPEIAYLRHGTSGIILSDYENPSAYADAVAALMLDDARRKALVEGARAIARDYTIEAMAAHFVVGVMAALDTAGRGN